MVVIIVPSSRVSWCLLSPCSPHCILPPRWCHLGCLGTCVALSAAVLNGFFTGIGTPHVSLSPESQSSHSTTSTRLSAPQQLLQFHKGSSTSGYYKSRTQEKLLLGWDSFPCLMGTKDGQVLIRSQNAVMHCLMMA